MQQVELREINRVVSQYRKHQRAKEKLQSEAGIFLAFYSGYGRYSEIPVADDKGFRAIVSKMIDGEIAKLRKRLGDFGIDPVETKKKKKEKAKK